MSFLRKFAEVPVQALQALLNRLGRSWRIAILLISIAAIALALAGYGWWWKFLSDRMRESASALQSQQHVLGRNLEWNSLEVSGFPYLVEGTLSKVRLLAPDLGTVWDGERVTVVLKPLSLSRIAVSLEGQQHVFYVGEGRWIEADGQADKALFKASSRDDAQIVSAEIERLTGTGKIDASDFHFILDRAKFDFSLNAATEHEPMPRADIAAHITNLGLQGNLDLALGPVVDNFDLDIGVKLPDKLPVATGQAILAAWRKTDTPIEVRQFAFDWGGVSVAAVGEIKFDTRNLPEGHLRLTLGNHSRILELLEAQGWITKETHATAKPVLDVLAFVSGDPKRRVSVPLKFENGEVFLGPARIMKMEAAPATSIPDFVP
ncbi:MAG: DUF2125 domain-containing protein [Micropepsaceae bacterium]